MNLEVEFTHHALDRIKERFGKRFLVKGKGGEGDLVDEAAARRSVLRAYELKARVLKPRGKHALWDGKIEWRCEVGDTRIVVLTVIPADGIARRRENYFSKVSRKERNRRRRKERRASRRKGA